MRFTPTGVGTGPRPRAARSRSAVHPHGRGDRSGASLTFTPPCGSPPRAWGQAGGAGRRSGRGRFTPTGVGTGWPGRSSRPARPVHPHGRGDRCPGSLRRWRMAGSPPRAWGQDHRGGNRFELRRFTPTGVGTGGAFTVIFFGMAVHPHGRGDRRGFHGNLFRHGGSPPRAWGQGHATAPGRSLHRFTPTGVGTGEFGAIVIAPKPVHPHGRGDRRGTAPRRISISGSPPRAWGQGPQRRTR